MTTIIDRVDSASLGHHTNWLGGRKTRLMEMFGLGTMRPSRRVERLLPRYYISDKMRHLSLTAIKSK